MTRFQRYPAVLAAITGTDRLSSIRASLGAMLDDCFGATWAISGPHPWGLTRAVQPNRIRRLKSTQNRPLTVHSITSSARARTKGGLSNRSPSRSL